jgi:cation transport ATPase-like protein
MVRAAMAALEATEQRTSAPFRGLTQAEAALCLRRDGPNQLPQRRGSGSATGLDFTDHRH